MIAPSYNSNLATHSMGSLASLLRRKTHRSLILNPEYRPRASDSQAMADELIVSLRVLDQEIKSNLDIEVAQMARRKEGRSSFKRIRDVMLTQLAAFEFNQDDAVRSVVYFIEVGGEGDNTLYLCRSSCKKIAPLESWSSERLLSLDSHALMRAFMHRCAWASGYAVTAESLLAQMCNLYFAYTQYVEVQGRAMSRLAEQGWLALCRLNGASFIVKRGVDDLPHIQTVFADKPSADGAEEFSMIAPKGRFAMPRCVIDISCFYQKKQSSLESKGS